MEHQAQAQYFAVGVLEAQNLKQDLVEGGYATVMIYWCASTGHYRSDSPRQDGPCQNPLGTEPAAWEHSACAAAPPCRE